MQWDALGKKYFVTYSCRVEVIGESEKSYKIRYEGTSKESWVRKKQIEFNYLSGDFCLKRNRALMPLACRICTERCAVRGKDLPARY